MTSIIVIAEQPLDLATAGVETVFEKSPGNEWRINYWVVEFAVSRGFQLTPQEAILLHVYEAGTTGAFTVAERARAQAEMLRTHGIVDMALNWLNEHVAHDRHFFGWHDGEIVYGSTQWWS